MSEDLLIRFVGLDLISNIANDIGYGVNRLAGRIIGLNSTSSAQMRALARASGESAAQIVAHDEMRAASAYRAGQAVTAAEEAMYTKSGALRRGNSLVHAQNNLAAAQRNAERIDNENEYTSRMDRLAQQRISSAEKEEAALIASRQRMMAAFTQAGTIAVMAGAAMIGVAAGIGGAMLYAADQSAKFEQRLLLIQTQAGGTAADVNLLRTAALTLGPQFGYTAQAAADAAYHIESVGLRGKAAVDALKYSMMGARIGMADLEATSNMLATIMASHLVPAGRSAETTMATLDAIIGQGNIRMDALSASFRTGLVGALELAGVGLRDAGAALATLTDLGYSGATAGTALRSALTMIAAPTNKATELLRDMGFSVEEARAGMSAMQQALLRSGINVTQFAAIVRRDGIAGGLEALHNAMVKGGLSADEMSATITKAFGGSRIGSAFKVLFENLDRLKMREAAIAANSTAQIFEAKWAATSELLTTKLSQIGSTFNNLVIILGEALTPAVVSWLDAVSRALSPITEWATANQKLIAQFAPMLVAFLAIGGAVLILVGGMTLLGTLATALISGFMAFGPVVLGVGAVFALIATVVAGAAKTGQQNWAMFHAYWETRVIPAASRLWNTLKVVFDAISSGIKTVKPLFDSAFSSFATQLPEHGGLWDNATLAFSNFSNDLLPFSNSDPSPSLTAPFAVSLPAALKISLDQVVLFADTLQLAFTAIASSVKVAADQARGDFGAAATDAAVGYKEIARLTQKQGDDMTRMVKDSSAMFDKEHKEMWQKVYNDPMAMTAKRGDDGAPAVVKAHQRMTKVSREQMKEWQLQAKKDGVSLCQDIIPGML